MSDTDWRSAETYEALRDLSSADLAWEFLRRNPKYQDEFARFGHDACETARWAKWGLTFAADPHRSADEQAVFWRPELCPRTVGLTPAPASTVQTLTFEPQNWRGQYVEREACDGVHALLNTPRRRHRLWMPQAIARGRALACVVPLGADAACGALGVMQFWKHLAGKPQEDAARPDEKLRRARMSLRALDGRSAGESYRGLAEQIFGAGRIAQESWKTSSLRDTTIRLVRTGLALAGGDYRRLLRQRADS